MCEPCLGGSYALFGAPTCAPQPAASSFEATSFGAVMSYPPNYVYDTGSHTSLGCAGALAYSAAALLCIPAILLLLLNCGVGSAALRERFTGIMRSTGIDSFFEARATKNKRASSLGGAFTIVALGTIAAVAAALIERFAKGNFLVISSVLPISFTALDKVGSLPFRSRIVGSPTAPPELPSEFTSGLIMRVAAQGPACSNFTSNTNGTPGLVGGSWAASGYSTRADPISESHVFDFVSGCAACTCGPLSGLDISLDGCCQNIAVTVAAVGAQGDVTLYSFSAAGTPRAARSQYHGEVV